MFKNAFWSLILHQLKMKFKINLSLFLSPVSVITKNEYEDDMQQKIDLPKRVCYGLP